MTITTLDVAWMAGLLEGEASFLWDAPCATLTLSMKDRDIVARAAALMGAPRVRGPYRHKGKPHHSPYYVCSVNGAKAVGWMMTIFSFLGERRRDQDRKSVV